MVQTIWLLTHETEFNKPSNTGQLVVSLAASCDAKVKSQVEIRLVRWSRVKQDPALTAALKESCLLVYPTELAVELEVSNPSIEIATFKHLLIIDATWQLARKIYNQSAYLHQLPAIKLAGAAPSRYLLRRNQLQTGWCTAEITIILLDLLKLPILASELTTTFMAFNQKNAPAV